MKDKKVLVIGMARSGVAAAALLHECGAHVTVTDLRSREALGAAIAPIAQWDDVTYHLGQPAETLLMGPQARAFDAIVVSPGVPTTHPALQWADAHGIEVMAEIELSARIAQGTLIAITGTNGKTTTTTLIGEIMKNAGKTTHVVGNIGEPFAAHAPLTTENDAIVCEVSSFQLERIHTFHPVVALVLNITEDHLNRHGTMENYIALKERVFENQAAADTVVLNGDDPVTRAMAQRAPARVAFFSRTAEVPEGAFVRDGTILYRENGVETPVCRVADVQIPGAHNLENALAATAATLRLGVSPDVVRHTLQTFPGVEHRIEPVRVLDGVRYINDSKGTNVDSTIKAVQTMAAPTVLIAGGSEKNMDFAPLCREIVRSGWIAHVILIGATGERLGQALASVGYTDWVYAGYDFEAAIHQARACAVPGGNVLLSPACASFDMFDDYEQRGRVFKRIVNALPETAT